MRFYGPAASCEELLKIGYTRNGFYLVKGIAASNIKHVELVDCLFKNPKGIKESKKIAQRTFDYDEIKLTFLTIFNEKLRRSDLVLSL